MAYLTDRKRAEGLGAARKGTDHHISMMLTSFALLILVPLFIFTVGCAIGRPYEEVIAFYQRPFPSLIAIATFVVGFWHFAKGAQVVWEDYSHGLARKVLIASTYLISLLLAGAGILSVIRLAL